MGGSKFVGVALNWGYEGKHIHLSMQGYVEKALKRFGHEKPRKTTRACTHEYGTKKQFMQEEGNLAVVGKEEQQYIRQILGTF